MVFSHFENIHELGIFFFFNDTATTEIYTLSLHDALPICSDEERDSRRFRRLLPAGSGRAESGIDSPRASGGRSEEHTSELQSQSNLGCRLMPETKNTIAHSHAAATAFELVSEASHYAGPP